LFSSAPYEARLIVDRYLAEKRVFTELMGILFELGNGHNPELLQVGPLAGNTIEALCREIVKEVKPQLSTQMDDLNEEQHEKANDLIASLD